MKIFYSVLLLLVSFQFALGGGAKTYLEKGWNEKKKDNNVEALKFFGLAYQIASEENNTKEKADALLNLGICYYGISYSQGLDYAFKAMAEYDKLNSNSAAISLQGRSKCLQLISTINGRQGKYFEAIKKSTEALKGFSVENDTTAYVGLIYTSLGSAYKNLGKLDSAEMYHQMALMQRLKTNDVLYLPSSYSSLANLELLKKNFKKSKIYFDKAYIISDSTGNKETKVLALIGLGNWYLKSENDFKNSELKLNEAIKIASDLADKKFYLNALQQLTELKNQQGNFKEAYKLQQQIASINDSLNNWEKHKMQQSLEVQFDVSEKDRLLKIAYQEKKISRLTIFIMLGLIFFMSIILIGGYLLFKRINKRDKQLIQAKEDLIKSNEEKKIIEEQKLKNEIEFKESQLSAISLQMLQKNELLQELKEKMEADKSISNDNGVSKLINKGLNQEQDWVNFNSHFESINKNFYTRIKQAFPEVSPNELKICALIKMNLSIKEMAAILNISPDSVKTARYRLRKKLQLNTEDNLTDFILSLQ